MAAWWIPLAWFVGTVVAGWLYKELKPKDRRKHGVTLCDPTERLPVVYGEARVWTNRVFIASTDDNKTLWQVLAYAHGECDSIVGIYLDGQTAWLSSHSSNGYDGWLKSTVGVRYVTKISASVAQITCGYSLQATHNYEHSWITGDRVILRGTGRAALDHKVHTITKIDAYTFEVSGLTSDPGASGVEWGARAILQGNENGADWTKAYIASGGIGGLFTSYLGTDSQTADASLTAQFVAGSALSRWTSAHRGRGVAYAVLKLRWDEKVFSRGVPNVEFRVKGKKVWNLVATTAWSDNPAYCLYDYLTNSRYGLGLPSTRVDLASFQAAASYCNELVTIPGSTTQKRYRLNGVVDGNASVQDNLQPMLAACRGTLVYQQGKYFLFITKGGQTANADFAVTPDTIVGEIRIALPGVDDLSNVMTVSYVSADAQFTADQFEWPTGLLADNSYYVQDASLKLVAQLDLPFVTSAYQAQHIASIRRHEQRAGIRVDVTCTEGAAVLTVGDVVSVTHPASGFSAKPFWVMGMEHDLHQRTVRLALLEYEATAYPAAGEGAPDPNIDVDAGKDADIPGSEEITPPTALALSSQTSPPRLKLSWSMGAGPIAAYEILWGVSTEPLKAFGRVPADQLDVTLTPVQDGLTYHAQLRAVAATGAVSAWVWVSAVANVGKYAQPTYLTPTATSLAIQYGVTFDANTKYVEIYSRQHSTTGQANPLRTQDYLCGLLTPDQPTLDIPTINTWYRRTILVPVNEDGEVGAVSPYYETQTASGTGPTGTPVIATSGDYGTDTTILVSLTAGDGTATAYRMYRDGVAVADIAHSETMYTYVGLQPNTAYTLSVREIKNGVLGTESTPIVRSTDVETLDAPADLAAYGGAPEGQGAWINVHFTIGANAANAEHELYRAPDVAGAPGSYALHTTLAPGLSAWAESGTEGQIYWFKARAVQTGYTTSGYSNEDAGTYSTNYEPF